MAAEIYITSGFLGAGKTTLIRKLLKEAFGKEKTVLIENDFGEISVDAALLKSSGIEVKELNSGCICCSLSGDFAKALEELLDRFRPDKIIIEPSGVGKLSDIVKACSDPHIQPLAKVKTKITVVDVKRCKTYLDNFGEFFEDQIQNADVILFSRTTDFPDRISGACKLIKSLNPHAVILSKPWDQVSAADILCPPEDHHGHVNQSSPMSACGCGRQNAHSHEDHDHADCKDEHNHAAEDCFDTVTVRTKRVFRIEDLKALLSDMEHKAQGTVLRAKGIVRGPGGYVELQYLPGDIRITECAAAGSMLCIIGRNLDRQELVSLFSGE